MRSAGCIRFETFELDPETGELWRDDAKLPLQEKPFQLLLALVEHPGEITSRDELLSRLWPEETFGDLDHGLNVAVNKLRETLGDSAEAPRFVETLPRRGYRFIAPVEPVGSGVAVEVGSSPYWSLALVLLVVFGLFLFLHRGPASEDLSLAAEPISSLAVLPFENSSRDPGQEYLSDGVTGAIITELGQLRALRVISWQSGVQFRDSRAPLPEIASLLDVEAIVLGSVLRSGDRIQVTAQLFDADPERLVWAATYDDRFGDLLDIQREVARAVAREIQVVVRPEERTRLAHEVSVAPTAHDSYLRGLHHWNRFSKPEFLQAIEHFEEAIALEPGYAEAHAALADTWSMLSWYGHLPPRRGFPEAEKAARRALALDPELAAAHNSLAAVLNGFRWRYDEALTHQERALELNPSSALARNWYSWLLAARGRHGEALAQIRLAQRLDPLSVAINTVVGMRLFDAGRYDEAVLQLQLALEMNPHFFPARLFLGMAYQQLHRYEEAVSAFEAAAVGSGDAPLYAAALASGLATVGHTQEAEAALLRLVERSRSEYVSAYHIATVFLALGRIEEAFAWLERAYEERAPWLPRIDLDPRLEPLRSDPRFQDLRRRVGLVRRPG